MHVLQAADLGDGPPSLHNHKMLCSVFTVHSFHYTAAPFHFHNYYDITEAHLGISKCFFPRRPIWASRDGESPRGSWCRTLRGWCTSLRNCGTSQTNRLWRSVKTININETSRRSEMYAEINLIRLFASGETVWKICWTTENYQWKTQIKWSKLAAAFGFIQISRWVVNIICTTPQNIWRLKLFSQLKLILCK